jgi:hypothetical protein
MFQACNPSYPGGRDQEDHSLKPANSSWDPISKIPNRKQGWQSGSSGTAPAYKSEPLSSNSNACQKKKKENTES